MKGDLIMTLKGSKTEMNLLAAFAGLPGGGSEAEG